MQVCRHHHHYTYIVQRYTVATASLTKLESIRIDGNILGEKLVPLKYKLEVFFFLFSSFFSFFYRDTTLVTAMICNLPFPITPPSSLRRDVPLEVVLFVNEKIEKAERKRFFMYRGLCFRGGSVMRLQNGGFASCF